MDVSSLDETIKLSTEELDLLDQEFTRLEDAQRNFTKSINELQKYQSDCFKEMKHQKYRLTQIKDQLKM